jgi:UDP-N-acetylmuramate dehydrogenase
MSTIARIDQIAAELEHRLGGDRIERNLALAPLCTYRVGGSAALAVLPRSTTELAAAVRILGRAGLGFDVLGQGSNVLVSDQGSTTPLIVTTGLDRIELEGPKLLAQSGVACTRLSGAALGGGLTGLEFFHCLPGSAGGAAFMNGRAFGQEVSQVIEWAEVVTADGEIETLALRPQDFAYKRSPFMDRPLVIARVGFRLQHARAKRSARGWSTTRSTGGARERWTIPPAAASFATTAPWAARRERSSTPVT